MGWKGCVCLQAGTLREAQMGKAVASVPQTPHSRQVKMESSGQAAYCHCTEMPVTSMREMAHLLSTVLPSQGSQIKCKGKGISV